MPIFSGKNQLHRISKPINNVATNKKNKKITFYKIHGIIIYFLFLSLINQNFVSLTSSQLRKGFTTEQPYNKGNEIELWGMFRLLEPFTYKLLAIDDRLYLKSNFGKIKIYSRAGKKEEIEPFNQDNCLFRIPGRESASITMFLKYRDNGWGKIHAGIDLATEDRIVIATAPGKVVKVVLINEQEPDHGLGNTVIIEHELEDGSKVYSLYAHLNTIDAKIKMQSEVKANQEIGEMGASGYGEINYWLKKKQPIHLHFEIKEKPVLNAPREKIPSRYGYVNQGENPDDFGYYNPNDFFGKKRVKCKDLAWELFPNIPISQEILFEGEIIYDNVKVYNSIATKETIINRTVYPEGYPIGEKIAELAKGNKVKVLKIYPNDTESRYTFKIKTENEQIGYVLCDVVKLLEAKGDRAILLSIYLSQPYEYEEYIEDVDKDIKKFNEFIRKFPKSYYVPTALAEIIGLHAYVLQLSLSNGEKELRINNLKDICKMAKNKYTNLVWKENLEKIESFISKYKQDLCKTYPNPKIFNELFVCVKNLKNTAPSPFNSVREETKD